MPSENEDYYMINSTKNSNKSKQIQFAPYYHWMIDAPLNNLELYIYGGLYGLTLTYGGWRGSIDKLTKFLILNERPSDDIDNAINHLSALELITVKDWTYRDTYEISAKQFRADPGTELEGKRHEQ